MGCPRNAIIYNSSLCACPPGQLYNRTSNSCFWFNKSSEISMDSGVDYYSVSFPETIFSFDSIKKFSQSQAVFLEATLVLVLSWLVCCMLLRFTKLGDGRNIWFRLRWWISRLDVCYSTRHWLDDQKVITKRKTELGGTLSIASLILFIGLFAALLYQIIAKRTIEVHNVRATNAPDLASFINDLEFNITTVSSMSCSNLRGLGNIVTGTPGFADFRVSPLSNFVNYACHNTSMGPTLNFKCSNCHNIQDHMHISWQFVDIPNNPAMAVGFHFNFTAKNNANEKHLSFVSATLKNGSNSDDRPVTFRGKDVNILKFNLFPRIFHNLHYLKLLQPLFHEFLPGSLFDETNSLRTSLQSSNDGLINTTILINYLSSYVVEIENRSIIGPVSFLADLGGLYCFSIAVFFYFLVQCEYRIKSLRKEDSILQKIRNRQKAQQRWDKLRRYVMYTWGCQTFPDDNNNMKGGSSCANLRVSSLHSNRSLRKIGSSRKRRQQNRWDGFSFSKKISLSSEKKATRESSHTLDVESGIAGSATKAEGRPSYARGGQTQNPELLGSKNNGKKHLLHPNDDDVSKPPHVLKDGPEVEMSNIQNDYSMVLKDKLVSTQSYLHTLALAAKATPAGPEK